MGTPIEIELTSELEQYILEYCTEQELPTLEDGIIALLEKPVVLSGTQP